MGKKNNSKSGSESVVKQRNPVALNPLMKKSHAHTKSAKADRIKGKQDVKRALKEQ